MAAFNSVATATPFMPKYCTCIHACMKQWMHGPKSASMGHGRLLPIRNLLDAHTRTRPIDHDDKVIQQTVCLNHDLSKAQLLLHERIT